jgi:hypothetical protein
MNPLAELMALFQNGGWAPGVQRTGVRPDFGLAGAQIKPMARSPYERTLRPGETRGKDELRDMLAEVIMAAGAGASPVTGPRGVQLARTAARVRPGGEAAFNLWFEGSKAVNEKGEPLTLYHGTQSNVRGFRVPREGGTDSIGVWFADKPDLSNALLRMRGETAAGRRPTVTSVREPGPVPEGSNVIPTHVSIKNPLIVRSRQYLESVLANRAVPANAPQREGQVSALARNLKENHPASAEVVRRELQKQGYDGIRLEDDYGFGGAWIAFRPSQVKSAIGNRGSYASDTGRLRR